MPLCRGGKVITEEGYLAKIVRLSGGAGEDPLLLELEVTGIGLRKGVPASQVTALGTVLNRRTSERASGPRALEPWQQLELLLVRAEGLAADLNELAAVVVKSTTTGTQVADVERTLPWCRCAHLGRGGRSQLPGQLL